VVISSSIGGGGTDSGNDSGTDSGNDSGTDSGNDSGTDSGNDSGTDSGNDSGSSNLISVLTVPEATFWLTPDCHGGSPSPFDIYYIIFTLVLSY